MLGKRYFWLESSSSNKKVKKNSEFESDSLGESFLLGENGEILTDSDEEILSGSDHEEILENVAQPNSAVEQPQNRNKSLIEEIGLLFRNYCSSQRTKSIDNEKAEELPKQGLSK